MKKSLLVLSLLISMNAFANSTAEADMADAKARLTKAVDSVKKMINDEVQFQNTLNEREDVRTVYKAVTDARLELLEMKAQLTLAKARRGLPIFIGITNTSVALLTYVENKASYGLIAKGISVVEKITPDNATGFTTLNKGLVIAGRAATQMMTKYPKTILVTSLVATATTIDWYLLAAENVKTYAKQVDEAAKNLATVEAQLAVLLMQPEA